MTTLPQKELLRVDEVAKFFRVTERTVRRWIEHGHLAAERTPGRGIRIIRDSALKCRKPFKKGELE